MKIHSKPGILVIGDKSEDCATILHSVQDRQYFVVTAADDTTAMEAFTAQTFDLVVLDLRVARERGLQIARELRTLRNVPILFIDAERSTLALNGLEHDADDYITYPFQMVDMLFRVGRILKRGAGSLMNSVTGSANVSQDRKVAFAHCRLNTLTRELVTAPGKTVHLTDFEYRLLLLLVANPGRVLSRSDLSKALTGHDWSPLDRTIDGHIARLRGKIQGPGEGRPLIKSVRNVGYVFAGDVALE